MDYETAKIKKEEIEAELELISKCLNSFGFEKLPNGLSSKEMLESKEYQDQRVKFKATFSKLRDFNKQFFKIFKKEIKAERRQITKSVNN